jgi:single stranded DNA-binding protein
MFTLNQLTIIGLHRTGSRSSLHHQRHARHHLVSVATKESWKNVSGTWESRTEWHRVVCFSRLAEYARTLAKGSHVMVQGSVRTREYEKDGIKQRTYSSSAPTASASSIAPNARRKAMPNRRTTIADP